MEDRDSDKKNRSEYRVSGDDTLSSLLERIRDSHGEEVLLDITENELLQKDGSLRRTLVSAADEIKKKVAFSFSEKKDLGKLQRSDGSRVNVRTVVANKKEPIARHDAKNIPISRGVSPRENKLTKEVIKKTRVGDSGKKIAVSFSFFAGILLACGFFFILPYAEIKIFPEVEPVGMVLEIKASDTALNIKPEERIIPAQIIMNSQKVQGTFKVSGGVQRGEKARGVVKITNKTVSEQKIKGKSRLATDDGIVYTLDEAVFLKPHSSLEAKVTADQGGLSGNLTKGRLYFVALPKSDREILFADIEKPLLGGTDNLVRALSEEDLKRAKETLLSDNKVGIIEDIAKKLEEDVVRDERFYKAELTDFDASQNTGAEVEEFGATGNVTVRYFAFRYADLFALVDGIVRSGNNTQKQLSRSLEKSELAVNGIDWDKNEVSMSYVVQNSLHEIFNISEIRNNLEGRTEMGVKEYLIGVKGIKDVSVKIGPFWVKRVPSLKRNIKIELAF